MTLQEILTYVEELAFKNSMFGYDKDEVDIQLDKICDEVEALVAQKDKEIEALKKNAVIVNAAPDMAREAAPAPAAADFEDMVSRAEYDAVVVECTQLKVALEKSQKELTAVKEEAEQSEEAAKIMIAQVESAQAMLTEVQEQAQDAEAKVKELQEKLDAAYAEKEAAQKAAEETVEEAEEVVEETAEEAEEPAEETKEEKAIPQTTDEAYKQYMMYANLLCQQLAEVETKHSKIVDEASAEADQIRSGAQTEADQIRSGAQTEADQIRLNAQTEADQILTDAKAEASGLIEKAKTDAEEVGKEYMSKAIVAEEQCKALTEKKASLVASLSGFGEEIAALLSKVQDVAAPEEDAAEE